ncbi:MAG: glycogen phosphorylase [Deltaproteobacteria bacterium RIFOXYA12_FULL_61_11]|nr:MAG: glycogen phosphorylase [Deltaproteobacteria bacterium RIFOXYA12_FULL_61_11]
MQREILDNLRYELARFPEVATNYDWYLSLAATIRHLLLDRWTSTAQTYLQREARTVCYLSAEFMLGPQLRNNLLCLGLEGPVREALTGLGLDLETLAELEEEPGLGNGGLGRLAACYLDSLATLDLPTIGYGLRYQYGIFDQRIEDGWQVEESDTWLKLGNPWEVRRPDVVYTVSFGGHTLSGHDERGRYRVRWLPQRTVRVRAYDTPILGYRTNTACLLRLWTAEGYQAFNLAAFNHGDFWGAVIEQTAAENLTKVLYPNDKQASGKLLRLQQQYLLVSCALQDMVRIHLQRASNLDGFHRKYAVQLNDTHPSLAIPELMHILLDHHGYTWEAAWAITERTFAYTNHTLLPEALECWSLELFAQVLPRHLEIIYELNRRFLAQVRAGGADEARIQRLSLIDESGERSLRMANLATVGSHTVNGVAALHSSLLTSDLMQDFFALWPEKFTNVTNGVSPRRFVGLCNPGLTALITEVIGEGWLARLERLRDLEPLARDRNFQEAFARVKLLNKQALAERVRSVTGAVIDPHSLLDVQIKRIHEYKRQHLNILHVIARYLRLRQDPSYDAAPRTILFAGKAAPGYAMARLIIKLIHAVAEVVNNDPLTRDRLKVVFYPDFNVKNAEHIYPAAEVSEQLSTAGKEASGTGNMKLALNGALTLGTLDGANVEIREQVGAENFYLFGYNVDEIKALRAEGYRPWELVSQDPELAAVLLTLHDGTFAPRDSQLFQPILDSLVGWDEFMVLADFRSLLRTQERIDEDWRNHNDWSRRAILNVARMGMFSSDRAIAEYAQRIWRIEPQEVPLCPPEGHT